MLGQLKLRSVTILSMSGVIHNYHVGTRWQRSDQVKAR